jgi:hypothetical protein
MHHDFIDDLLEALNRIIQPDRERLRDLLIFNGLPEDTQNLRYLSYNRQAASEGERTICFSAAAVINNRRIGHWRLAGYREKLSQIVFNPRWTKSPLDLFLIRLRGDAAIMDILDAAAARYTLVGILYIEERLPSRLLPRQRYRCRPVVVAPGVNAGAQATIEAFEKVNEIKRKSS